MSELQKCSFCNETKGGLFVSSPDPLVVICEGCIARCAMLIMGIYESRKTQTITKEGEG